jgi:hypothetical protein
VIGRPAPAGLGGEGMLEESEGEQGSGDGAAGAGRFNRTQRTGAEQIHCTGGWGMNVLMFCT